MARRAAWLRSERPRRRRQRRRPQRRRSAEKRRRSLAPPYSLRLPRTSTTASKGPAQVDQRIAHCDRFRLAGSGRRQGRRRDRERRLHPSSTARSGRVEQRDGSDPAFTMAEPFASGLALRVSRRRPRSSVIASRAIPKSSHGAASAGVPTWRRTEPGSERSVSSSGSRSGPCTRDHPRCTLRA
jgi:hypothetical protein